MFGLLTILSVLLLGVAIYRNPGDEAEITVGSGGLKAGSLVSFNSQTWLLQGLEDAAEGDVRTVRKGVVVELTKKTATDTFAVSATVAYNNATQDASTATNGDFDITGKCRKASGSGDLTVWVELNR
ncbi:MAG: hypothetical protein R3C03_23965 [Pirellulaceae bacterium]